MLRRWGWVQQRTMAEPDRTSLPLSHERRDPAAFLHEADQVVRQANLLIRYGRWMILLLRLWPWIKLLLTIAAVGLAVFALYWQAKPLLFGRTMTFTFGGVHAPHYTRAEFEAEYIRRFTARGFTIESFRITAENHFKQFNGVVTVMNLPFGTSKHAVLGELRAVSNSMKEKPLTIEK